MKPFAFVFPGQGSQAVGMLDAWGDHPAVRQTLQEACDALGEDIARLIHEGPKEALALTTNTQPVMLVAGVAAWRAWQAEGGAQPSALAGHSLGEYSALVAAGALTLAQAAPLVRFRAQAMQDAVPVGVGAMAAILGMDAAKVIEGCAQVTAAFGPGSTEVVQAVNFNDPAQTVIAGSKAGVEKACEVLKGLGAKEVMLRQSLDLSKIRPLDTGRWAGAVDNLGGDVLSWIASTMLENSAIASIGLAASMTFNTTVAPFILRGVALLGVNSATTPYAMRVRVWERLAGAMKPRHLEDMTRTVAFKDLQGAFEPYIKGQARGRVVVAIGR